MAWLKGEKADRVPDFEFGAWEQAIERWHGEGLPKEYRGSDAAVIRYFHTDDEEYGPSPWLDNGMRPGFEWKVVEAKGDSQIIQDHDGALCEMLRPELGASIPRYLKYAIETRKDWEKIRDERLNPDDPGRVPGNLGELCKASFNAEYPVSIGGGSIYGWLRNWMGVERISEALIDEPEWVEEMMEHLTGLTLNLLAKVAGKCRIDWAHWWEDMCYKSGPLISPAMFKRFMVPRYKRITDFLKRECQCDFNILDCDGRINALVGLWLEGGINVMFPVEAAHTDGYDISKRFGKQVPMRGYYDKRALISGKAAIDAEFERLRPLFVTGTLVPHTDHRVPPDVSWENYRYYRRKKCELVGKTYREG